MDLSACLSSGGPRTQLGSLTGPSTHFKTNSPHRNKEAKHLDTAAGGKLYGMSFILSMDSQRMIFLDDRCGPATARA